MLLLCLCSLGCAPAATVVEARDDVKIGVIDTQRIMRESKAAKDARSILRKDLESKRATLRPKEEEVRRLQEELRKDAKGMSLSERKEKAESLEKEVKELRRLRSDLEEELKKKDRELTQEAFKEIREIVESLIKKEKYTIVLEKRSVVGAADSTDITDKVIRLYDNKR